MDYMVDSGYNAYKLWSLFKERTLTKSDKISELFLNVADGHMFISYLLPYRGNGNRG
jgi:hypothetical protein